ncbi:hypothetical protein ACS0TY_024902 [Phlomoides rotata]
MSPPVTTPNSTFEPDFHSSETLKSSESFDFSVDSTYTAGFSYSKTGTEKSRSRPRIVKMRKRQMPASRHVKTDLGINELSDGGENADKLRNAFVVNSGSNGTGARADSNGSMDQFGSGLAPGASLNDSSFHSGSGNEKSLFGFNVSSSTNMSQGDFPFTFNGGNPSFDAHKETGSFMFGARKDCRTMNQNLSGGFSSKSNFSEKDTGGNLGQSEVQEFKNSDYDSASQVKLGQQDSNKFGLGLNASEFGKFSGDKSEPDKVSGNTIPDVRGKVKLDTNGDSDKVCNPCFQFPFNCSDNSNSNHVNFVFGIDLEKKSAGRNRAMHDFADSGKDNAENGFHSQDACLNGVFVFGGLKGKGGFNSNGSTNPFNKVSELNRGKADDCDNSCSDTNFKFQSSGDSFEKDSAFSISDEMNKLNIGDSEVHGKKSGIFSGNSAVNTNNVFVFRGDEKSSDFMKENHPCMSQKTPEVSRSSHSNSESDRASSSFFPSAGIGVEQNGGFSEVPSMNKGERDSDFTGKLGGLDSPNADYSTPNMKFDFSKSYLFPGIDKLDNTNLRSLGGKKSKKKNGKLRQRTVVHDLFRQNRASEEGNFHQNHESPGNGSPMDFSPYQDTSTHNAPVADTGTGIKENIPTSGNHISEHCEWPHDDMSTSKFSPSLTAQDGLSALKTQYKKKYKLKVRSNPTIQTNDPVKENAKQEPSGTAIHEACEHWRIRGNDAYHAGQLSKAEEFYSTGINSAPHVSAIGYSMRPLLLCYSNRAATRMSLGRMREAIEDCTKASALDPDFLKATLRAGNCYLVLGEVEDAIICYTKCLSDGTSICLDRRVTIEAADGLHKAKKVAEQMVQSANLLQKGTDDAASSAMGIIEEALLTSRFSEQLLQMKGEVLCMLRMYEKVIQLCERTLDVAQKNLSLDNLKCKSSHVKWRWHLLAKSHYRLGKLDSALDLIEKEENLSFSSKTEDETRDSSIALAVNIRELLSLKKSGNQAFSSGRYTEAVENYTSAISKSFESRGFMAICFCNRAAAYQSLGQIIDAISDCSIAIALDENYLKAISRRATLHEMIRDYKQAIYDLQKLVSLLESQSQIKNQAKSSGGSVRDLRKARCRLSLAEEKAKKEISLDLYLILGIKESDTESEIKKSYRKAALRHHPDKAGQVLTRNDVADDGTLRKEFGEKIHTDADRLFKVIGEAYAVLSDPSKRSKYDEEEEMRKIYRDSNRNSSSEHPSTSYTSPFERGSPYGRQSGYSYTRRYWYEARSYSNTRW